MRHRPHRRNLVVFSSSAEPANSNSALQFKRPAGTGRIRSLIRISMLLTVIAVRPRWRPLLAGTALMALSLIEGRGGGAIFVIPGLIFLWHALLIPGDTDADHERRAQLRRELAAFSTPAHRRDLEATLDRYPDAITYAARNILAGQAVASRINGTPGAGPYVHLCGTSPYPDRGHLTLRAAEDPGGGAAGRPGHSRGPGPG